MRWGEPQKARSRLNCIFAWLPTRTKSGAWVWLEECWRYEHNGAAAGIFDYYCVDDTASLRTLTASLGFGPPETPTDGST